MRRNAAFALRGVRKAAEPAIPLMIKKIQDSKEDHMTRVNAASSLYYIGSVPAATKAVPDLLAFMTDSKHDCEVRLRVSWALRVHKGNLRTLTGVMDAYRTLIKEPLSSDNKMLRYDGAYMLAMISPQDCPEEAIDLLNAFLHDTEIKLFDKATSGVGGTSTETIGGIGTVKEIFGGDARTMAVEALESLGPRRYAQRADIMKQLRVLAADKMVYEPLRKKAAELIKAAKLR